MTTPTEAEVRALLGKLAGKRVLDGLDENDWQLVALAEDWLRLRAEVTRLSGQSGSCARCEELARKVDSLKRWRCDQDCRYTMGDVADISGSHCPGDRPCLRCANQREGEELERENAKLRDAANELLPEIDYYCEAKSGEARLRLLAAAHNMKRIAAKGETP